MNNIKELVIIKLGGSVITEKKTPFSLNENKLENLIKQIIKAKKKCIVVHGAGSFGHPLANFYKINEGRIKSVPNQIYGLTKTHNGVSQLNAIIERIFLKSKTACLTLHPSSIFIKDDKINSDFLKNIQILLHFNIIPILYGDIMFHMDNSFSILSGDRIILEICKLVTQKMKNEYIISKVIFCFNEDGIISLNSSGEKELLTQINYKKISKLQFPQFEKNPDVTGGFVGKLEESKKICKLGITVQLINGNKENYLLNALENINIPSTVITKE